jgi:hypothetical protein
MSARALGATLVVAIRPSLTQASVISGDTPVTASLLPGPFPGYGLVDMGPGITRLEAYAYFQYGNTTRSYFAGVEGEGNTDQLHFSSSPLAAGTMVDGSVRFYGQSVVEVAEIQTMPPLLISPSGTLTGTFGFRYTPPSGTYYGWANVTLTAELGDENGLGGSASATVNEWAWESEPDTPITVGAVPEPTSTAMLLIAAPALVLRQRR